MKDFSLSIYGDYLETLLVSEYLFVTFKNHHENQIKGKEIILRHDVDKLPENALNTAIIENEFGIKASYYFRIVKESYNEKIIKQIAGLGHEIGYHYEDLSLCNGDYGAAIKHFEYHLNKLRKLYPVKTICMHGSPLSKYDNKDLWKKYNYRDFGIIAEPYFDVDFNEVFYLTDTGRRWDGDKVSVRDKVDGNSNFRDLRFHSTMDIIEAVKNNQLPDKIMITTHPQRWDNRWLPWAKELVVQNMKNVIKRLILVPGK